MQFKNVVVITIALFTFSFQVSAQQRAKTMIHFETNSSKINTRSEQTLSGFAKKIGSDTVISAISLAGHCDSTGPNSINDPLSVKRAKSARSWLIAHGAPDSLFAGIKGFGKNQPIATNSTVAGRNMNRRVEISYLWTSRKNTLEKTMLDTSVHVGSQIVLRDLYFVGNRHLPLEECKPILNDLYTILEAHPSMRIEIIGYICCYMDDDSYDADNHLPLSAQRAKYVYDYLIGRGIDAARLSYKGMGSRDKLYPHEKTDYEKAMNRRVEIKFISK